MWINCNFLWTACNLQWLDDSIVAFFTVVTVSASDAAEWLFSLIYCIVLACSKKLIHTGFQKQPAATASPYGTERYRITDCFIMRHWAHSITLAVVSRRFSRLSSKGIKPNILLQINNEDGFLTIIPLTPTECQVTLKSWTKRSSSKAKALWFWQALCPSLNIFLVPGLDSSFTQAAPTKIPLIVFIILLFFMPFSYPPLVTTGWGLSARQVRWN